MRIDAHLHLWRRARGDYGWLTPALGALWRDVEPDEAAATLAAHGVDRAVLVQAAPTEAETAFLLDIADAHYFVAGVVGWIDFEGPAPEAALERFAARPRLIGVRPMLQDLPDSDWIADPRRAPVLERCAALGLAFDGLVRPLQLPALERMARAHPDLRIVVDHGGKPDLSADLTEWRSAMARLAALPNLWCKLSGLVTEAGGRPTPERIAPAAATLLDLFGPYRLIWGSDWPVCTLAATYSEWDATTGRLLAGLTPDERAAVLGGTARRFYRLEGA